MTASTLIGSAWPDGHRRDAREPVRLRASFLPARFCPTANLSEASCPGPTVAAPATVKVFRSKKFCWPAPPWNFESPHFSGSRSGGSRRSFSEQVRGTGSRAAAQTRTAGSGRAAWARAAPAPRCWRRSLRAEVIRRPGGIQQRHLGGGGVVLEDAQVLHVQPPVLDLRSAAEKERSRSSPGSMPSASRPARPRRPARPLPAGPRPGRGLPGQSRRVQRARSPARGHR